MKALAASNMPSARIIGLFLLGRRLANTLSLAAAMTLASLVLAAPASAQEGEVIKRFDFSVDPGEEIRQWLEDRDFELKHHLRDEERIALWRTPEALHLRTRVKAFGMMAHEEDIHGARHLRLDWGVSQYPAGASYQHGIDDEAIMIYVFFGHETFDSGSFFIPDSPYFIGFYLCADGADAIERPFNGNHFEKSGRYICVAHPEPGESTVSMIDLEEEFRKSFGLSTVPGVSGMSLEVDTTHADNDGHAAAFINSLEFLR